MSYKATECETKIIHRGWQRLDSVYSTNLFFIENVCCVIIICVVSNARFYMYRVKVRSKTSWMV